VNCILLRRMSQLLALNVETRRPLACRLLGAKRTRSTPRAVMVLAGIRRTGLWNVRHRNLLRSFKLMPASLINTLYRIAIARSGALIR